jgi:putative N6-adenine-specific DNA methylase
MVEKMKERYKKDYFYEDGALYAIKIQAHNDIFIVMMDTSGDGLHKRGYRAIKNEAPIKETMAAALVKLSRGKTSVRSYVWNRDYIDRSSYDSSKYSSRS